MPWIKVIAENEAEGELKEVYRKLREQRKGEKILGERSADWQIQRARAGAERAAELAKLWGVSMPSDPWRVR